LGKGLDVLFRQTTSDNGQSPSRDFRFIDIDHIHPNPHQPRKKIAEEALQELAQSIQDQGLLQPLLVRPSPQEDGLYELVAGERRWRASKQVGLKQVPVIVSALDETETLVISLIENLQREDLNAIEEAEALSKLYNGLQISQEDISRKIGKSRSSIANSLRLLHLDPTIQDAVRQGKVSSGQARTLLAVSDSHIRETLFEAVCRQGLTVRQLERVVAYWKENGSLPPDLEKASPPRQGPKKEPDHNFRVYKKDLQEAISAQFKVKVHIHGEKTKGSISLKYSSEDELRHLLASLGVVDQEDQ
jgi:ParB family chromosome partitioning protein